MEQKKILYVNSCVRKESRTDRLSKVLLNKLGAYEEERLTDIDIKPLNEERLNYRMSQQEKGNYKDKIFDLAKRFAEADVIVISAPYWDGQFPAILKIYLENIYAIGVVTAYGPDGGPQGLCKAKKLYYVSTAGGNFDPRFSYDYVSSLVKEMFGIPETELIYAENLDMEGNDPESILAEAMNKLR